MLIEHRGKRPSVDPTAYVAPTAVLSGDVTVGRDSRILFGAILTAEGGPVTIGAECIVMENAVVRGTSKHPVTVGDNVLIGPRAYLSGCEVADEAFLATGTTVFNGARIGRRAEVRINGVVHIRTVLKAGDLVPIGWVAVGDPATRPPDRHDDIAPIQRSLDFPRTVFGLDRNVLKGRVYAESTKLYTKALRRHLDDRVLDGGGA